MRIRLSSAVLAALLFLPACRVRETSSAAVSTDPTPTPGPPARAADAGYAFRPRERTAVDAFLRKHTDLRVAEDDDRRASEDDGDLEGLYGVYHPYFVRGDLNDDGILDFVMAFVRRDSSPSTPWFSIVVFPGKEDASGVLSFGPETFLERDITLAAGDLAIDRDAVVITPDLDDDTTRRYRWDPARRAYIFVRDDESDAESPDLSRT